MDEREESSTEVPQLFGDATTHDPPPEVVERGHEDLHANTRGILLSAVGLVVLMMFGILVSVWLMVEFARHFTTSREGEDASRAALQLFEAPETPNLAVETQRQRRAMRQILQSYGWVQREPAIARIPIDRAIGVIAERGFQPWGESSENASDQGASDGSR